MRRRHRLRIEAPNALPTIDVSGSAKGLPGYVGRRHPRGQPLWPYLVISSPRHQPAENAQRAPETFSTAPEMYDAASESRNSTASAISFGSPARPIGKSGVIRAKRPGS